jgi:T4 superinfection immunity protein
VRELPFTLPTLFRHFRPSIIALARSKRNTLSILLLNCFLGWTLVGWAVPGVGCEGG